MTTHVFLPLPPSTEQALTLPGRYPWNHFKSLQSWANQTPGLKITYLDGVIELMTTGKPHERVKKLIAILIEAYCFELGIRFFPSGNATCEAEEKGASFDPDESSRTLHSARGSQRSSNSISRRPEIKSLKKILL